MKRQLFIQGMKMNQQLASTCFFYCFLVLGQGPGAGLPKPAPQDSLPYFVKTRERHSKSPKTRQGPGAGLPKPAPQDSLPYFVKTREGHSKFPRTHQGPGAGLPKPAPSNLLSYFVNTREGHASPQEPIKAFFKEAKFL